MNPFWAYEWMDFHGIKSMRHVRSALADKVALNHLHELAVERKPCPENLKVELVAGRGVDLSGHLDCNASECRKRQVDDLLRRAWHYFDRILVADGLSHEISHHWEAKSEKLKTWLAGHLEVLLYLRSLGAEDLLIFSEKPVPCEAHLAKHSAEAGLPKHLESDKGLLSDLTRVAKIDWKTGERGTLDYTFVHPKFEHTVWGTVKRPKSASDHTVRHEIAKNVAGRYLAHLASDMATARHASAPLGAAIWMHGRLLHASSNRTSDAEVIFHLELPVLQKVPIDALLKIRRSDGDAFERFRVALRKAVATQRANGAAGTEQIADQIRMDIIEPELLHIKQRLTSAERSLKKKAAVGIGMGSLATTCGLLAGIAPGVAVSAGIATLAAISGSAAQKNIDDRREVELSDMYFLWKAMSHGKHELANQLA